MCLQSFKNTEDMRKSLEPGGVVRIRLFVDASYLLYDCVSPDEIQKLFSKVKFLYFLKNCWGKFSGKTGAITVTYTNSGDCGNMSDYRPYSQILITLCHELLHAIDFMHGEVYQSIKHTPSFLKRSSEINLQVFKALELEEDFDLWVHGENIESILLGRTSS